MSLRLLLASTCLLAFGGCASAPQAPAVTASAYPPEACGAAFPADAPLLELRRTRLPESADASFAQHLDIDRSLGRAGRWTDRPDGWSSLALALQSPGAQSLSLHLSDMKLPPRTQIWFCSPDGRLRHGPYREATGGELWTPVVPGERAHLQIWVPTAARATFTGRLADAQGGYR